MTAELVYVYIGDGSALPGLPARDVTNEEVAASGYSVEQVRGSGLYVPVQRIEVKINSNNKEK